ncbi:MAG: CoA transferase [Aestuariivita sp.]|nr:CoA transferase [Aestuariivita sp.]
MVEFKGPLDGVKVLDLSRILAGPTCTQLLGDLGASVLKIENPTTRGDDTRTWGPPFIEDSQGNETDLSAYFMVANRNKRSIAVDIKTEVGQDIIKRLASHADIFVENFKPGGLAKYNLDYEFIIREFPALIYCSISGFGQTGPNRSKRGYDLMAQGYGGIMSLTGHPEGAPMKVGVGISDVMCGMYACVGILAALHHRNSHGVGQKLELALVDTQIAWLINEGVNYLTEGKVPKRLGNAHPNIAPYETFEASDGFVIITVGNDKQFKRFCQAIGKPRLAKDQKYLTNPLRVRNRETLIPQIASVIKEKTRHEVISHMEESGIPAGPVNQLNEVFNSNQVAAREMLIKMTSCNEELRLIGNPLKFSKTPVSYRYPPPRFGADTEKVLESQYPFSE